MRAVALDVHRDFCEVAIVEEGRLRSAGLSRPPAAAVSASSGVRSKTEAVVVAYREKIIHPKVPHGIPSREPVDEHASRPARSGRRWR